MLSESAALVTVVSLTVAGLVDEVRRSGKKASEATTWIAVPCAIAKVATRPVVLTTVVPCSMEKVLPLCPSGGATVEDWAIESDRDGVREMTAA